MNETILALLVAAFQGVRKDGLSQLARIIALQVATEEEAKTFVDKLTKAQVDEFVKDYRADVDKEVSESNKTFEANLKKKFDFVEKEKAEPGGGNPTDNKGGGSDDIAALIKKAVEEAVKPFQSELASYKADDVAKSRLQTITEKLSECNDEVFKAKALKDFARMRFDTDDDFNEYLADTETDIETANQNVANSKLGNHSRPWASNTPTSGKEATKEEIDKIIDKLPI